MRNGTSSGNEQKGGPVREIVMVRREGNGCENIKEKGEALLWAVFDKLPGATHPPCLHSYFWDLLLAPGMSHPGMGGAQEIKWKNLLRPSLGASKVLTASFY